MEQTRKNGIIINSVLPKRTSCEKKNYFGETLKELRLSRNKKQYEAAELLQVTPAQWSLYESGKSRPTLDTILDIAEIFSITPFALLGRSLDKSKYAGTGLELSFEEYEKITIKEIESLRKKKREEKVRVLTEMEF